MVNLVFILALDFSLVGLGQFGEGLVCIFIAQVVALGLSVSYLCQGEFRRIYNEVLVNSPTCFVNSVYFSVLFKFIVLELLKMFLSFQVQYRSSREI